MKKAITVCLLILLINASVLASKSPESIEKRYGPGHSSLLSGDKTQKLNIKTSLTSSRGTSWNSYPLYGGEMTSIANDPNNPQIVYIGTRDAGVYKTTNGGNSWHPAREGLTFMPIRSLAIDQNNSSIIYAGTDYDGVWKSIDSGATWFKSSNGLYEGLIIFNVIIDQQNPDILYAGLAGGTGFTIGNIYKSKDGGANWELSDNGLTPHSGDYKNAIFSLAIDPDNSAILYAGTNFDGAFMSTDTAKTWSAINDSLPILSGDYYEAVNALAVDPHHSGRVCALISGMLGCYYIYNGSYWQMKSDDYEQSNNFSLAHLYFHPTDTSVIYSAGSDFVKSTDGGTNWDKLLGWSSCSNVPNIAFNSLTPNTIFAATDILFNFDGGVFKSINQGVNWNECSDGITATVIRSVAIDPQNPNRIYAGEGNGHFYRSEDGGTTWVHEYFNADEIADIKVDFVNSSKIYLASLTGLYKSTDYGDNFNEINEVESPGCIAIHHLYSNIIYAGSAGLDNGIYKSSDSGATWVQKNDSLPEFGGHICPILSIAIDPNDTSVVWAGTQYGGGIVKSTNGGNYWVSKGLTDENFVDCIAINPNNSNEILVGAGYTDGNIYKSINGGDTWVKKDSLIAFVFDIKYDPRDPDFVYAATEGYGVLRSTDGGETWHDYSSGIFYPIVYSLDIAQNDSVLLVAGTYGSGAYYIHPELSGITEQDEQNKPFFSQESSLELSGISTSICFNLPKAGITSLKLYDIMGREVTEILNGYRPAGKNEISWNTEKIPAGIYFYQLEFEGLKENKKVTFIK